MSFIVLFALSTLQLFGQENKEVKKLIEEASEHYRMAQVGEPGEYLKALHLFLTADSLQPNDPSISYSIGVCYSHTDHKMAALPYLEKAKQGKVSYPDLDFHLACSYHLAHRFEEAINLFNVYKKNSSPEHLPEVDRHIFNCEVGIELVKHPVDVKISNLGPAINSKFPDYHPTISADEKTIIFISRRDSSTGGYIDPQDNHYYEDIYLSDKVNNQWAKPIDLGFGINTDSHDGSVGLSADGQELFIYRWSNKTHGDLYVSDLMGAEWSFPVHLGHNINTKSWESDVSVTPDKKVIFFTSDRKGGQGGRDIYMARRLPNGEYAKSFNLGLKINTKFDEDAPFIHPDGKTLYFSSRGHKSMGGYDIFSCTIDLKTGAILSDPVNVGYPINTADDDVFFVWSADNKRAYFASERIGGYGEKDIYLLERKDIEAALVVLKGKIKSCEKDIPLAAQITVIDLTTQEAIGTYTSNSSTGNFIVILPAGKNYAVRAESPGYLFYSENIDIPFLDHYEETNEEICLERMKVGTKIVLRNVFFDVDKATLRKESEEELARLVQILQNNKFIKIEISGHTDSDGNDDHNLKLSDARAHTVVDYLIKKGIETSRLTYKGYGETMPFVENDTPEHKQLNRRTEFEIIE